MLTYCGTEHWRRLAHEQNYEPEMPVLWPCQESQWLGKNSIGGHGSWKEGQMVTNVEVDTGL